MVVRSSALSAGGCRRIRRRWVPLAGAEGATVATVFTLLPSFAFIFLSARLLDATRHNLKFIAPLSGITVTVVGAIVNLAIFFA